MTTNAKMKHLPAKQVLHQRTQNPNLHFLPTKELNAKSIALLPGSWHVQDNTRTWSGITNTDTFPWLGLVSLTVVRKGLQSTACKDPLRPHPPLSAWLSPHTSVLCRWPLSSEPQLGALLGRGRFVPSTAAQPSYGAG